MLPPTMETNKNCEKLSLSCSKLKEYCSKTLNRAVGKSKDATKCKNALGDVGKENIDKFCSKSCPKQE